LTEFEYFESVFFQVLDDLAEYLGDLTLVGGWLSYVYAKYLWGYFGYKTGKGCLMIEKENGPDVYVDDLRQDIFERFENFRNTIGGR